jgi:hypothetical protein
MKLAPPYVRAAKNEISGKWEVRLNSRLQSKHDTFSQAENKAHQIALKFADKGITCEILLDTRG